MQIVAALLNEVVPAVLSVRYDALSLAFLRDLVNQRGLFVRREQRRNHARGEHVVNHLQEVFVLHMRIRKEEHHRRPAILCTEEFVELLEILAEVLFAIAPGERYLEDLIPCGPGGEFGQTLLSRSAHTDKQGVAPGHFENTMDPNEVVQRVLEEHQVDLLLRIFVVEVEYPGEHLVDGLEAIDLLVELRLALELRVTDVLEVTKQARFPRDPVHIALVASEAVNAFNHLLSIRGSHKTIVEDTQAFVSPEANEGDLLGEDVGCALEHSLVHSRQIPQVEHIVELRRGSLEFLAELLV
mmetsp:Transcript_1752/g.3357  ORF Transcript_1752/g.3357 Transcript_1752/m.3357 type:complete len:298 (-) Transcript_1752:163-1056(-)